MAGVPERPLEFHLVEAIVASGVSAPPPRRLSLDPVNGRITQLPRRIGLVQRGEDAYQVWVQARALKHELRP